MAIALGSPALPVLDGVEFRLFRDLDDIPAMAAANARLRTAFGVLEPIDVDSMRNHYAHLENSDATTDCLLAEMDGRIVGYARCEWHDLHDGDRALETTVVVEPTAWGRGITRTMLEWSEARLRIVARALPAAPATWFTTEVFGAEGEPLAATREVGYEIARPWAEMARPSLDDPLPDQALPPGYTFRIFAAQDRREIWDMLDVTFHEHWGEWRQGEDAFEEWTNDPRQDPALYVGVTDGTEIAAVVLNLLDRRPDGTVRGELGTVGTHPAHRRRGLARACIARSLRVLRDAGATTAYLGVDMLNENQALTLYESCGFVVATRGFSLRKAFRLAEETR